MIAKTASSARKQWHKYVDYIVWAIRESVSESLGVAPWTLVGLFARLPRGPFSILKETWEGAVDSALNLGKNTVEFLRNMQNKLETVRNFICPGT